MGLDRSAQEDARSVTFAPGATLELSQGGGNSGYGYRILYAVTDRPQAPVTLAVGSGEPLDITQQLAVAAGKSWREMIITGACTTDLGPTLTFASQGAFALSIGTIVREEFADGTDCSF